MLVFSTYSFRPFARNGSQSYFRQTAFQSIKFVLFFLLFLSRRQSLKKSL